MTFLVGVIAFCIVGVTLGLWTAVFGAIGFVVFGWVGALIGAALGIGTHIWGALQ